MYQLSNLCLRNIPVLSKFLVMGIPKGLYYGWFNLRTASLPLANPGGSIVALRHCRSRCSFRSLPPPSPFPSIWFNRRTEHCVRIALFRQPPPSRYIRYWRRFDFGATGGGGGGAEEPLAVQREEILVWASGFKCQILSLYSAMVRSLEKTPEVAVLVMAIRHHLSGWR